MQVHLESIESIMKTRCVSILTFQYSFQEVELAVAVLFLAILESVMARVHKHSHEHASATVKCLIVLHSDALALDQQYSPEVQAERL